MIPAAIRAEFDELAVRVASLAMRAEAAHYVPVSQFMGQFATRVAEQSQNGSGKPAPK